MSRRKSDLRWVAWRMSVDPWFLGSALAGYRIRHRLTEPMLRSLLRCTPAALVRLELCRRPDENSGRLVEGIFKIAKFAPCDFDALLFIVQDMQEPTEDLDQEPVRVAPSYNRTAEAVPVTMLAKGGNGQH